MFASELPMQEPNVGTDVVSRHSLEARKARGRRSRGRHPMAACYCTGLPGYQRFDSLAVVEGGNVCVATLVRCRAGASTNSCTESSLYTGVTVKF